MRRESSSRHRNQLPIAVPSPSSSCPQVYPQVLKMFAGKPSARHSVRSSRRERRRCDPGPRLDAEPAPDTTAASLQPSNGAAQQAAPQTQPPVEQAETPRDVVFVSSEVAPWSKTGGLGDVVGSLPMALARRGHRVMVISPRCSLKSTQRPN